MACCGNARSLQDTFPPDGRQPLVSSLAPTWFAYTGKTRLVAVGGVTRRIYRFEGPGARTMVDRRDAPSLAAIGLLVRLE